MERQNLSFRRKVWQIDGWFTIVLWLRSHCAIYACATLAESRHPFVLQPGKTKLWPKMRGSLPRKAECSTVVCARLFQVLIISHLSFLGLMSLTSAFWPPREYDARKIDAVMNMPRERSVTLLYEIGLRMSLYICWLWPFDREVATQIASSYVYLLVLPSPLNLNFLRFANLDTSQEA